MSELGTCDLCGKPARWAVVVKGCSEHKIALKSAVENCNSNQQLKAKIAALADEVFQMSLLHPSEQSFSGIVDRMRQLSAV